MWRRATARRAVAKSLQLLLVASSDGRSSGSSKFQLVLFTFSWEQPFGNAISLIWWTAQYPCSSGMGLQLLTRFLRRLFPILPFCPVGWTLGPLCTNSGRRALFRERRSVNTRTPLGEDAFLSQPLSWDLQQPPRSSLSSRCRIATSSYGGSDSQRDFHFERVLATPEIVHSSLSLLSTTERSRTPRRSKSTLVPAEHREEWPRGSGACFGAVDGLLNTRSW